MNYPPYFLQNFRIEVAHHKDFEANELLYRRSPKQEPVEHFEVLKTDELTTMGLSVNRSKLCPVPEAVLWAPLGTAAGNSPAKDADGNYQYKKKEGYAVFVCSIAVLQATTGYKGKSAPSFRLEFSPVDYNLSHCLLFVDGLNLNGLSNKEAQKEKKAFRLYVASFFQKHQPCK